MEAVKFLKEFYTILFVWLSSVAAIDNIRRSLPFPYRAMAFLLVLLGIIETIANLMAFKDLKNHFLFNIIYGLRAIVVPVLYRHWIRDFRIKRIVIGFVFGFVLLALIETVWLHGFFTLHTYSFVMGGTVILLLSIAYLWQLYADEESQNIIRDPVFWFCLESFFLDL